MEVKTANDVLRRARFVELDECVGKPELAKLLAFVNLHEVATLVLERFVLEQDDVRQLEGSCLDLHSAKRLSGGLVM